MMQEILSESSFLVLILKIFSDVYGTCKSSAQVMIFYFRTAYTLAIVIKKLLAHFHSLIRILSFYLLDRLSICLSVLSVSLLEISRFISFPYPEYAI